MTKFMIEMLFVKVLNPLTWQTNEYLGIGIQFVLAPIALVVNSN